MPYSIRTKDGIIIDNIPDETPKDDPSLKARVAAMRAEQGLPDPNAPKPRGIIGSVVEAVTGSERATPETQTLPEWTGMPELNSLSMRSAKTGLGTMFAGSDEVVKVILANNPGVKVRKDAKGNYILRSADDGKEYAIPPGLSVGDIPRIIGGALAVVPAARTMIASGGAKGIIGGAIQAGATQTAIEGSQAATGGEFNPEDIAMATAAGAALPAAGMAVKAAAQPVMKAARAVAKSPTGAVKDAASAVASKVGGTGKADVDNALRESMSWEGRDFDAMPETVKNQMRAEFKATGLVPDSSGRSAGGAAAVEQSAARQAQAAELPVPIRMTEGQKTRKFEDVRFERETAKLEDVGAPLRQRFDQQNRQIVQNMDAFIDATGTQIGDDQFRRQTGIAVSDAIRSRAAKDKVKIRTLYKEAEKAGEMAEPVALDDVAKYLNDNRSGRTSAPILSTVADELEVLGIGSGSLKDGTLKMGPVTLQQAEGLRKVINKFAKDTDPNDLRVARELKDIIDQATAGAGGAAYRKARASRAKYAADYENVGLVRNLVGTKRGTTDRAVALEDVVNQSVLAPSTSLDSVRQLRKLLQTEGEQGQQAWRELQAATIRTIKEQSTKSATLNEAGESIVSPAKLNAALKHLDDSGKLDFVFSKKGAEQMRTLNDVSKLVLTTPPGTVNHSNTASVLAGLFDVVISGAAGIPAPLMTSYRLVAKKIKDKKLREQVMRALGQSRGMQ